MATTGKREQRKNDDGGGTAVAEPSTESAAPKPIVAGDFTTQPLPPLKGMHGGARSRKAAPRPDAPAEFKEEAGFFDTLKSLSDVEWESYIAYLYRLAPITDRRKSGSSLYLTKYSGAFDEETVKQDWGSGGYKIRLNFTYPDGNSKTVRLHIFDIEDPDCPPKVPPGEWIDDPQNKRWAWARPKEQGKSEQPAPGSDRIESAIEAVGKILSLTQTKPDAAPADPLAQLKGALELVKSLNPQAAPAPPDPVKQINAIGEMLDRQRPPADSNTKIMELLMARNVALEDRITKLFEKMLEQSSSGTDPKDLIKETLATVKQLQGLAGTSTENPWIGAVVNLADRLSPAVEAYFTHRGMEMPASAAPGQPPAGERAAEPSSPPAAEQKNKAAFHQHRNMVLQIAGPLLSHLQQGQPGGEFAAWFIDGYGYGFHNSLKALGKEQIMLVIKSIPELWSQIQPMDQLFSAFLDEFLAWAPPEQSDHTVDMPPGTTQEPTQ